MSPICPYVRRSSRLSVRVTKPATAGGQGGEGGSSRCLLPPLSEMADRGSDGGVMEAECHNNTGRTGAPGDGSAMETEAKRAEV
ncbi:hypothetical protein VZT92_014036 [Zoarces viviparus]|uniref:Uncharacterized protein n=1 Tax=Zoarces viviparus TaxID=48416 RepID=A0AAW1EYU3_ZOAVI